MGFDEYASFAFSYGEFSRTHRERVCYPSQHNPDQGRMVFPSVELEAMVLQLEIEGPLSNAA